MFNLIYLTIYWLCVVTLCIHTIYIVMRSFKIGEFMIPNVQISFVVFIFFSWFLGIELPIIREGNFASKIVTLVGNIIITAIVCFGNAYLIKDADKEFREYLKRRNMRKRIKM